MKNLILVTEDHIVTVFCRYCNKRFEILNSQILKKKMPELEQHMIETESKGEPHEVFTALSESTIAADCNIVCHTLIRITRKTRWAKRRLRYFNNEISWKNGALSKAQRMFRWLEHAI